MASGYASSTWLKRCDELGAELWRYEKEGEFPRDVVDRATKLISEAHNLIQAERAKKHGFFRPTVRKRSGRYK
jgi:hypothetical protein